MADAKLDAGLDREAEIEVASGDVEAEAVNVNAIVTIESVAALQEATRKIKIENATLNAAKKNDQKAAKESPETSRKIMNESQARKSRKKLDRTASSVDSTSVAVPLPNEKRPLSPPR